MMIDEKRYKPPFYLRNKHLQTIIPALFRKVELSYEREVLTTPDNDFLEVDWIKTHSLKLAVLFHGLEGNSNSQYIRGLAKVLSKVGFDVLCVNFRGCGGRPNKKLNSYHSGQTDDYKFIFNHLKNNHQYEKIYAVGFSLGGNALLKYLGETNENSLVDKVVAVSVPVDLKSSAITLSKGFNKHVYLRRFLRRLKQKVSEKEMMFPDAMEYGKTYQAQNFEEFDDVFTAPVHGFNNAEEYWAKCSSKQFIKDINVDTIIINALNDPFLPKECYPFDECNLNENVTLLTPKQGGHVGFPKIVDGLNYYEKVVLEFFKH